MNINNLMHNINILHANHNKLKNKHNLLPHNLYTYIYHNFRECCRFQDGTADLTHNLASLFSVHNSNCLDFTFTFPIQFINLINIITASVWRHCDTWHRLWNLSNLINKLKSLKGAKSKDDDGLVSGGGVMMVWGLMEWVVVDSLCEGLCDDVCVWCWVGCFVWCYMWWCGCVMLCVIVSDVVCDGVSDVVSGLVDVAEVKWLILCCFGVLQTDRQMIERTFVLLESLSRMKS